MFSSHDRFPWYYFITNDRQNAYDSLHHTIPTSCIHRCIAQIRRNWRTSYIHLIMPIRLGLISYGHTYSQESYCYKPAVVQFPVFPDHVFPVHVRRHSLSLVSQPITASFPLRLYHASAGGAGSEQPLAENECIHYYWYFQAV